MKAKTGYLQVPGARLYYETRGADPFLLLIAGGAGDAGSYACLAGYFVDHFTVLTTDRRGYARSPLDDPDQSVEIQTHSADAYHLLDALSGVPAAVLGCSIGALIGLDLAIRYPRQVHTLVAHEPSIPALLTGARRYQAVQMQNSLLEIFRREGADVAIQHFAEGLGYDALTSGRGLGCRVKGGCRPPQGMRYPRRPRVPAWSDILALHSFDTIPRRRSLQPGHLGSEGCADMHTARWRLRLTPDLALSMCSRLGGRIWWSFRATMLVFPIIQSSLPVACVRFWIAPENHAFPP